MPQNCFLIEHAIKASGSTSPTCKEIVPSEDAYSALKKFLTDWELHYESDPLDSFSPHTLVSLSVGFVGYMEADKT